MNRLTVYLHDNEKRIRTAIRMAWPSVLESFFVALAGLIDSLMVSDIGPAAVAAVGLTTQPKFLGMALFIALNVSVSAIVARRRGEQDKKGANQVLMTALAFTVLAGIAVSFLCVALAEPVIAFCGSNEQTHDSAVLYFRLIMGGMLFNIISLVINAAQRGAGNTRIAMKTNVTSNVVNMIGNFLLINGHFGFPALGIKGAAIATVFGTVIACVMSIRSLFKEGFISLPYVLREKVSLSLGPVRSMVKISSSVFTEQVLMRIGFMSTAVMAANLGTAAMAAHQVGMNIMSVSLVLSVVYLLAGRGLYRLFFDDPEIVDMGVRIMALMVFIVIAQVAQVIYMGCLRGAGDVMFTMAASTFSVTFVRTAGSYVMGYVFGLGILGVWMGVLADQLSRFILTTWRFKSGRWTSVKI